MKSAHLVVTEFYIILVCAIPFCVLTSFCGMLAPCSWSISYQVARYKNQVQGRLQHDLP